jgi:predicted RNA binding protein YcfA (HicA-like mRNA interferase family)
MEKLLLRLGFIKDRQNGSHCFYKHPDGRVATIPYHKGRDLSKSLTREILRQIGLSVAGFITEIKNLSL